MAGPVEAIIRTVQRFRDPDHPELRFQMDVFWDRDAYWLQASDGQNVAGREVAGDLIQDAGEAIKLIGVLVESIIHEMFPEETNAISEQQEVLFKHDDPNLQGSVDRLREPR